jgi:acetylornithine deacetylase
MLERLVSYPTVSRDSNLDLVAFVEDYLDGHGITSARVASDDGRKANLVANIGPQEPGGVVLSGHTDVVPVDGQPWATDPFRLNVRDRRAYGRGACDMKGFIAACLALVPEMKHLRRPVHLALSYDEEVGCQGAPRMIDYLRGTIFEPEAVIVGEPTSMTAVNGHKGVVALRTTVTGFETHSSQTHRGVSAVMTAARLVEHLNGIAERLAQDGQPGSGFEPPCTTVHVGVIHGGTAINIVARHCEFVWDVRAVPGDDPQRLVEEFRTYCRDTILPGMRSRWPGCDIRTETIAAAPSMRIGADSAPVSLVRVLTGIDATAQVSYAAEAGQYQAAGFAPVLCGPGSIDQAHQPDEYIDLSQLEAGELFLRRLIDRLSTA